MVQNSNYITNIMPHAKDNVRWYTNSNWLWVWKEEFVNCKCYFFALSTPFLIRKINSYNLKFDWKNLINDCSDQNSIGLLFNDSSLIKVHTLESIYVITIYFTLNIFLDLK